MNKALEQFVQSGHYDIAPYLKEQGIPTLNENALRLLRSGLTSSEEIYSLLSHRI